MILLIFHVCTNNISVNDYNQIHYVIPNNTIVDRLIYLQVVLASPGGLYILQMPLPDLAVKDCLHNFSHEAIFILKYHPWVKYWLA